QTSITGQVVVQHNRAGVQSVARTESFRYGGGQSVALAAKLPPVLFGRAVGDESPPTGGWGDGYVCVLRGRMVAPCFAFLILTD
ncbi:MAG: hypothetical protein ACYC3A_12105, partial [Halothiobacillus sp.]